MQNKPKALSRRAFSHPTPASVESKAVASVDIPTSSEALERHERVALLVEWVGGLKRAAKIADVSVDTINNWRKPSAALSIDGMLKLTRAAGLSLDWVATGHMIRPDVATQPGEAPDLPTSATLIRLIDARVNAALQRRESQA